jgi:hypothetical protein
MLILKARIRTDIGGEGFLEVQVQQQEKQEGIFYVVALGDCTCKGRTITQLLQDIEDKVHCKFLEPHLLDPFCICQAPSCICRASHVCQVKNKL